jgi:hypothetical protein
LFIHFELHFVYLLDMVYRHQCFAVDGFILEMVSFFLFIGLFCKHAVVDLRLLCAQFLFHDEQGIIVDVFRIATVLALAACAFVDLIVNQVRRYSCRFLMVETLIGCRIQH